jgi:hypothetical protein
MSESIKLRTAAMANSSNAGELRSLFEAVRTELVALRAFVANFRAGVTGNYLVTQPALAIGSTPTAVSSAQFDYSINGVVYTKAAVAAGTAPGNDVIPQSKYGAVAFDIGANGTIDAVEAPANATGYDSAALAVAALPAAEASHVRIGYVTATNSAGTFTFGTTNLNAANTTVAYTDGTTIFTAIQGSAVSETLAE